MEMLKKYRIYAIALAALVIIGALYFIFDTRSKSQTDTKTDANGQTIDLGNGLGITTSGGATVTEVGVESNIPQPSLDRNVSFANSSLPPAVQAAVKARIAEDIAGLKKNPTDLSLWLALGFELKQAGDYKGAEEMWVYVNGSADKDEVSALNLGDLYMNFLKDYPKAETYYKIALAIRPDNIQTYNNLFMLYKYLYKTNTSAAADMQAEALKKFPDQAAYIKSWQ